jgi:hypothetical protein
MYQIQLVATKYLGGKELKANLTSDWKKLIDMDRSEAI